ncbi:MAG TPA: hypothetical protein V6D09_23135 [Leptolyngbyaceae cyanobacterium]
MSHMFALRYLNDPTHWLPEDWKVPLAALVSPVQLDCCAAGASNQGLAAFV